MTKSVGLRVIGRATLLATVGAAAVAVTSGVNAVPVSKATPKEPAQYRSAPDTTAVICPPGPPLSENVSIAGASAPKIVGQTWWQLAENQGKYSLWPWEGQKLASTDLAPTLPATASTLAGTETQKLGGVFVLNENPPETPSAATSAIATWQLAHNPNQRGLSATTCTTASTSAWLLGGNTTVGHSSALLLSNPAEKPVAVRVKAFTATGQADAPGLEQVVVPPRGLVWVMLNAHLPVQEQIALQVTSGLPGVGAFLATQAVNGITPAGMDLIAGTAGPKPQAYVPGVVLNAGQGELLLANPQAEAARLSVSVLGPNGRAPLPGATNITIDKGAVFSLPLTGLTGPLGLEISSDQPVLSAVRSVRAGAADPQDPATQISEFAWATQGELAQNFTFASPVSKSLRGQILISNPGKEKAEVTVELQPGEGSANTSVTRSKISIDPGATKVVAANGLSILNATVPVSAALYLSSAHNLGDGIAVLAPMRLGGAADTVAVKLG